ncbi:PDR/VanB family oxidoreductase [Azoarcus sp. TTM-91]|uniref:PDR/VanB family oxidoreductase n=1 Tax=Azoarcus sp. TTM-91 TaxID=2691581 RepID=UPI001B7D13EA|nr:PDR/VanB family oxidoreductase [Azoarcus sp. TTM-91]
MDSVMELKVIEVARIAEDVMRVRLARADGSACAAFIPGAHLRLEIPPPGGQGEALYRRYSLTGDGEPAACYEIAVLRVEGGAGSGWIHQLVPGDRLRATVDNAFPLQPAAGGHLLIAGGIGITPMLGMARRLRREGRPFELHYGGSHPRRMAFRDEVAALGGRLYHREAGSLRPALADILARPQPGRAVYVCGPAALIGAVVAQAARAGWPQGSVHFELFDGSLAQAGDTAFEVEVRSSGRRIPVRADQSLLGALLEAGVEPLHDCKRGECGMCLVGVLQGEPDHRDHYLSAVEAGRNDSLCVCVSRSRSALLVLDL